MTTPSAGPNAPAPAQPGVAPYWAPAAPVAPLTEAQEEARHQAICRRELRCLSDHLKRSRELLLAHYDQLAWLSARASERHDEQRLEAQRRVALGAEEDLQSRQLEEKQRQVEERWAAEKAQREQQDKEAQQGLLEQIQLVAEQAQALELRQREGHEQLARERAELDSQRRQFEQRQQSERERWRTEQAEIEAEMARETKEITHQRQEIVRAEAALMQQREGLTRLRVELEQAQDAAQARENQELEALRGELETLKEQLAQRDRDLAEASVSAPAAPGPVHASAPQPEEADAYTDLPTEPRLESASSATPLSFDNCLDELTVFGRQLEADRRAVEADLRQTEAHPGHRNRSEAPANERAALAPQAVQLDRLREEIRLDMERLRRAAESRRKTLGKKTAQGTDRKPELESPSKPTKTRGTFMGLRRWLGDRNA